MLPAWTLSQHTAQACGQDVLEFAAERRAMSDDWSDKKKFWAEFFSSFFFAVVAGGLLWWWQQGQQEAAAKGQRALARELAEQDRIRDLALAEKRHVQELDLAREDHVWTTFVSRGYELRQRFLDTAWRYLDAANDAFVDVHEHHGHAGDKRDGQKTFEGDLFTQFKVAVYELPSACQQGAEQDRMRSHTDALVDANDQLYRLYDDFEELDAAGRRQKRGNCKVLECRQWLADGMKAELAAAEKRCVKPLFCSKHKALERAIEDTADHLTHCIEQTEEQLRLRPEDKRKEAPIPAVVQPARL
jgi:hypothetical protein